MRRVVGLAVLLAGCGGLVDSAWAGAPPTTFDAVVAGMKCSQQALVPGNAMECNYRVGRTLWFTIAGVGEADAGITFMSSSFRGDYYGSVGVAHGCVVVKTGEASGLGRFLDMAFVSPRDGKVYATWEDCAAAPGAR